MLITSSQIFLPAHSAPTVWDDCLLMIQEQVGQSSFETWFRTTELELTDDDIACIWVPNQFFADFIEEHFTQLISEVLSKNSITFSKVIYRAAQKDWKVIEPISESITQAKKARVPVSVEKPGHFHTNYTFDKFVIGDNNHMAHAAALAVAEAPGKTTFNPLIIYGGTGLGKTHLLQAVGHYAQQETTADNVLYMTSEEFTNQYINFVTVQRDSTSFYKRFNSVDLLLIDDIQFFSGKPGTQKEFYRIFDRLLLQNKQIILSSDRPPNKIPDMMAHIISRFQGGLVSDIQPPNLETRMAILHQKAEIDGVSLPEEVIAYIAGKITSNVRELEGILIRLIASSAFTGKDISIAVAQEMCGDLIQRSGCRISIALIQEKVAELYGFGPNQLTAHTRKRDVTVPRAIAMYLCKKWTKQSLRTIGIEFGGRDYSTVIHAAKKIEEDCSTDKGIKKIVDKLEDALRPLAS